MLDNKRTIESLYLKERRQLPQWLRHCPGISLNKIPRDAAPRHVKFLGFIHRIPSDSVYLRRTQRLCIYFRYTPSPPPPPLHRLLLSMSQHSSNGWIFRLILLQRYLRRGSSRIFSLSLPTDDRLVMIKTLSCPTFSNHSCPVSNSTTQVRSLGINSDPYLINR